MNYEIRFSNQATKFIKNLQSNIKERVISKFKEISENPFRFIEHYEGDYYKVRIGDFRGLLDIEIGKKIICVRVFDNRGRIYKR